MTLPLLDLVLRRVARQHDITGRTQKNLFGSVASQCSQDSKDGSRFEEK